MKPHLVLIIFLALAPICLSQTVAQSPSSSVCNDIFISYTNTAIKQLTPNLTSTVPTQQPYRFESTITIINNGLNELKSWMVFVGFQHNEYLVSASNAVLADGASIPGSVGYGTVFAGYPKTDLKTAVETAGDLTQMGVSVDLIGTELGVANVSMPKNISLANDGFFCPTPTMLGTREMQVCCTVDPNFKSNITSGQEFLPRRAGDLTIMYDVTKTYELNYLAQVTLSNNNPLGRLDDWKLSWDWMNEEFIFSMQGAYPDNVDTSECIFGRQGQFYKNFDFSTALNCQTRPTIVDLPPTKANDTILGKIPFCCRNGTILPPQMDPSQSKSVFLMNIFKMPPYNNRTLINPPQHWAISGTMNPDYKCGAPVRVSPSLFPDTNGLPSNTSAVASWQVVCNITQPKTPACCVSFSAYYNESVVPCQTCACGCQSNTAQTCSATAPAVLLPPEALLVPFENRTALAVAFSNLKHRSIPDPMPCPDNCGVSINWHVYTDYTSGWTARITLFNWGDTNFANWFTAVEMDKAGPGYEGVYSFNGTSLSGVSNTIFMQGLVGLNYLVAETNGSNPKKDPKVPGKQQSVISFKKKLTPGVSIANGDGFPSKVFFNGEECSLPSVFPTSSAQRKGPSMVVSFLAILAFMLMQR